MSLILDALRKADAERDRGTVPGLHAQPLPPVASEAAQPPRVRGFQWALAGVAIVGALAWYVVGRETRPGPGDSQATKAPASETRLPPAPVAATMPTTAAAPATTAPPPRLRGELPPAAEPAPWPTRESRAPAPAKPAEAAAPAASPSPARSPDAPSSETPQVVARPAAAPPADPAVYPLEQLPQQVRSQVPALSVTGAIYSPNAADRTLIVNGRLMREGQALSADLSLERIGQKSAVFRFRGYRFEIRF